MFCWYDSYIMYASFGFDILFCLDFFLLMKKNMFEFCVMVFVRVLGII